MERAQLQEQLIMMVLTRASRDEGARLLGKELNQARATYRRARIGSGYPGFWMEAPLTGPAGFDFHLSYDRGELRPGERFASSSMHSWQPLVDWFSTTETGGIGLGFAFDLRANPKGTPAAYVNTYNRSLKDNAGFFEAAGHPELAPAVEAFLSRLPPTYDTWYLGVFANRAGSPARVGCFLPARTRKVCALDPQRFAYELSELGFDACSDTMLQQLHELAQVPLPWEIQFDVHADGHVGDVLSIDLCLPLARTTRIAEFFADEGLGGQAMQMMEGWGVADDRWRLIPQVCFAQLLRPSTNEGSHLLRCHPSFLKVKWAAGQPQAAKVYVQGTARPAGHQTI